MAMKTANDLIPAAQRGLATHQPAKVADLPPEAKRETERLINELFGQLRAIYPAWKQAWTSESLYRSAKAAWTQALLDAGVSDWSLIERGLAWCRASGSDFIPSAGKFIQHCWPSPAELGAPEVEQAYREAHRYSHPAMVGHERWSHPAVYHAAIKVSRHSLQVMPLKATQQMFAEAYRAVLQRMACGEVLSEPPLALPADVKTKGDPAKANAALAAMRQSVNKGATP